MTTAHVRKVIQNVLKTDLIIIIYKLIIGPTKEYIVTPSFITMHVKYAWYI